MIIFKKIFLNNFYLLELKFIIISNIFLIPILLIEYNYFYQEIILLLFSFLNFFYYFIFSNLYQYLIIKISFLLTLTIFTILPIYIKNVLYYYKPIVYNYFWKILNKHLNFIFSLYLYYYIYQYSILIAIINVISSIILTQKLTIILELNPIILINFFITYTYLYIIIFISLCSLYILKNLFINMSLTFLFKKKYYLSIICLITIGLIPDDLILTISILIYLIINIELLLYNYFLLKIFKQFSI